MDSVLGKLLFGNSLPKVPEAPHVDTGVSSQKALDVNLAAFPKASELASQFNDFSSDQLLKQLNKVLPGYSDMLNKEKTQASSLLSGELPQDVQDLIGRKSAELGIQTGAGNSNFTKFGQLRDLGLTSLEAINRGFDATSRWIASAAKPQMMDFSSMFISPAQQIGVDQWNEQNRYGRQWLQNQLDAIPPAWQQATDQVLNWAEKTAASYATSSLGGMGGGGGGMGGGGGGGGSTQGKWNSGYSWRQDVSSGGGGGGGSNFYNENVGSGGWGTPSGGTDYNSGENSFDWGNSFG